MTETDARNAHEMGRLLGHGEVITLIHKRGLERLAHARREAERGAQGQAKIADEVGEYLLSLAASLPSELRNGSR